MEPTTPRRTAPGGEARVGSHPGLSWEEARARLARDGANLLPERRGPSLLRRLLAQLIHFFALMLWGAGGLAFLAGLPQLGVAIFVVIVLNGLFAFAQEHRAETAARRLRALLPRRATVVRDGAPVEIDAVELVVGDVVLLAPGDRISADLRVLVAHGLLIDTSTFTGESEPSPVGADGTAFAGTFVMAGEGVGQATATGSRTRLAGIARLAQAGRRPRSPLTTELQRVVRTISLIAIGVGTASFGAALLVGTPPADGFVFGIGVTVALVPEALLPTVTLRVRRRLRHGGPGTDRQRLRLPERGRAALALGLVVEPAAGRGGLDRAARRHSRPHRAAARGSPRPRTAPGRGLGRGRRLDRRHPGSRRAVEGSPPGPSVSRFPAGPATSSQ